MMPWISGFLHSASGNVLSQDDRGTMSFAFCFDREFQSPYFWWGQMLPLVYRGRSRIDCRPVNSEGLSLLWQIIFTGYEQGGGGLQYHHQCPGSDENTSDERFCSKCFMEKDKCEDQCQHNTEFIYGHNLWGVSQLQRTVVTKPGCAGSKAGQDEKDPAFSSDRKDSVLSMSEEYHSPGHHYDYNGSNRGCQIWIHPINSNFC